MLNKLRMLKEHEICLVGGGFDEGNGFQLPTFDENQFMSFQDFMTGVCPVDDWWPDFMEDYGDVKAFGPPVGIFHGWWTDGQGTWCLYGEDGNLIGKYAEVTNSNQAVSVSLQVSAQNGADTIGVTIAGSGGSASNGDNNTNTAIINLTRLAGN